VRRWRRAFEHDTDLSGILAQLAGGADAGQACPTIRTSVVLLLACAGVFDRSLVIGLHLSSALYDQVPASGTDYHPLDACERGC